MIRSTVLQMDVNFKNNRFCFSMYESLLKEPYANTNELRG